MTRIPAITGEYVPVYQPAADVFPGPDSALFHRGERYESWIPNDFTVIQGPDCRWHMVGITHPAPADFRSKDQFDPATLHDGEWQLFHAVTSPGTLADVLYKDSFRDVAKLLPPDARPGERRDIYAPHILEKNGLYWMFYGPGPIRLAVSGDLYDWSLRGPLFEDHDSARDPHILPYGNGYQMTYVSQNRLLGRYSEDLEHWGAPETVFTMPRDGVPESPFIVEKEGMFYLFWCIYDGTNGPYDNRTFVYVSKTPKTFDHADCIAELPAHAPEILRDGDQWYAFSAEWPHRGISAAPMEWR